MSPTQDPANMAAPETKKAKMTKTLYFHPASPPSRAAWMVAKELGVEVEIKVIDIFTKEQMEPWFLKVNPDHCVPTLVDEDFTLWESRTILRYLCEQYAPTSKLYPADAKKRAEINKQLDKDLGFYYKEVGGVVYPQLLHGKPAPDTTNLVEALKKLEADTQIKDDKFVCGDEVTIADYAIFVGVTFLESVKKEECYKQCEKLNAWVEKMKAMEIVKEVNAGFEEMKPVMWEQMGL